MGSLVYVELLDNPRYRAFLHQSLPWIGHVGIIHFYMSSLVSAAKNEDSGFVDFVVNPDSPWTANIWIRPLISQNESSLMSKLRRFVHSLLGFAKPEMKIIDSEWGEASIENRQFIGTLVVWPHAYYPNEQDFELLVEVKLSIKKQKSRRQETVPIMEQSVTMELTFKKNYTPKVQAIC